MRILRALLIFACLLVFVLPTPAHAAPTLAPMFYLPAPAELPEGFVITSTSGAGEFAGSIQQQQHYYAAQIGTTAFTFLLVDRDRQSAINTMAQKRQLAGQLGEQVYQTTVGDESYATIRHGMYSDQVTFVVRSGLVVAHTVLSFPAGITNSDNAAVIGYALMAPTLTRMKEHPDGV